MDGNHLIAAIPGICLPLDAERLAWRSDTGRENAIIDARHGALLQAMGTFRTREEHLAEYSQATGMGPSRAGRLLDDLLGLGVVVSAAQVLARRTERAPALPEPLLAIRTCRRPQGLARLLDSIDAHERRFGRRRRLLVIDDAADADANAATADVVATWARRRGEPVHLLGPAQRGPVLDLLGAGFDPAARAVMQELIDPARPTGRGGGRSWNLAVLAAAGSALSIIDDDIVLPARMPPGARAALTFWDAISADKHFYDDEGWRELAECDHDIFAWLGERVGQPVGALLDGDGCDAASLHGRSIVDLYPLTEDSTVLAAFTGNYGGLAWDSTVYMNFDAMRQSPSLFAEPFRLERLEANSIWMGVRQPRILARAVYTPLMIDARGLLPFSTTWGKADDTMFLGALSALVRMPAYLYAPALVGHFPVEQRGRLARSREPVLFDVNAYVGGKLEALSASFRSQDRDARLAAIGSYACDQAEASDHDLQDQVARWRIEQCAHVNERLSATLAASPHAPAAWREHLAAIVSAQRGAIADARLGADQVPNVRAAFAQFAAAARFWPTAYARARDGALLDVAARIGG